MKFKKLEAGRSMVEMLGVLAIIGVLSVGGIAGYSISMRKHRANAIIDLTSKYAVLIYGKCQQKIMDGEITGLNSCNSRIMPTLRDTDIGALPTGIASNGIWTHSIDTNLNTDIDTVVININFEDSEKKLCQAVASTAGSTCIISGGIPSAHIYINQN